MIVTISGSQQPINVAVTGSSQSSIRVGSQTIETVTLVVSTSVSPVNLTMPNYVTYAKSAGSASFAETASYALASAGVITNAISSSYAETASYSPVQDPFPYTGTAVITGTLEVTDNVQTNKLVLDSQNGLFVITGSVTSGIFGVTENIRPTISTASFSGATIDYLAQREGGVRIGTVMGIWSGSTYRFTDVSSTDIGDTSDLITGFLLVNDSIIFQVHSAGSGSSTWTVQSLFKLFPRLI